MNADFSICLAIGKAFPNLADAEIESVIAHRLSEKPDPDYPTRLLIRFSIGNTDSGVALCQDLIEHQARDDVCSKAFSRHGSI